MSFLVEFRADDLGKVDTGTRGQQIRVDDDVSKLQPELQLRDVVTSPHLLDDVARFPDLAGERACPILQAP